MKYFKFFIFDVYIFEKDREPHGSLVRVIGVEE